MKLKYLFENQDSIFSGDNIENGRFIKSYDKVDGNFYCYSNELISLEGCPSSVGKNFDCSNNELTNLEGGPISVSEDFKCYGNHLTSLEGGPSSVGGIFDCAYNQLTTLEGSPSSVGGNFICYGNQITSLEGGPSSVGKDFKCNDNKLTGLEGIGKRYLRQMNGKLLLNRNPIKSNVLGVLLIKGCKEIEMNNKEVQEILNKHLTSDRDIIECREELIAAGFKEFAKL